MGSIRRICLVGLDRIVGSFALGLKRAGFRGPIIGVGDASIIDQCWKLGLISDGFQDIEKAVVGADLIMLSSQTGHGSGSLSRILELADDDATISEMTRVKRDINRQFEQSSRSDVHYVGFRLLGEIEAESDFARSDRFFFERRTVILTPRGKQDLNAFSQMQDLLRKMGATVVAMSPQAHDRILSRISQLPHIIGLSLLRYIYANAEGVEMSPDMLGPLLMSHLRDLSALRAGGWMQDVQDNTELVQKGLDELIQEIERVKREISDNRLESALDEMLKQSGNVLQSSESRSQPELIMSAGADPKGAESAARILAKARIPIRSIEAMQNADPGTFRISLKTIEERDHAAVLLRNAGLEIMTKS